MTEHTNTNPKFPKQFNLADYYLFDRLNEDLADKLAVCYGEYQYSYQCVADRTMNLSKYFHSIGLESEQRVYVVLPDTPAFVWSIFATLTAGAVITMGNPLAPVEDLSYVVDYTSARVLICTESVLKSLSAYLSNSNMLKAVLVVPDTATGEDCEKSLELSDLDLRPELKLETLSKAISIGATYSDIPKNNIQRDDQAIWLFTSGSTGKSKAAVHTHGDFAFNTEVYAKNTIGYQPEDRTLSVPRLFFGYATGTNLFFPFAVGATCCLFSERPTAETLAKYINFYRPTVLTNVPTMMSKLLEYDEQQTSAGVKGIDFSSIRFNLSAGEALPPALLDRFTERFNAEVYDGIGSAEMFHIYISNRPGDIRPGSLGKIVDGYEAKILPKDAEGPGAEEVPVGEVGVLWIKGNSVAQYYHQDREKSWQTFYGHWCKTGDLFRRDEQGYYWFSGRADDLFKVGGIWVSPIEIEDCLLEHEAVSMAAVIPAEAEGLKKPKALVVLREAVTEANDTLVEDLQEYVKAKLSKHKYPRWVLFVDDLPKNDRGKIDRKTLMQEYA